MTRLSTTDRKLLDEVQFRFPLCARPFAAVAERLNSDEGDLLARLRRMKRAGIVRRIGPVYDARGAGLATTLVALSVPRERLGAAARAINDEEGVTHNYLRNHRFNVWFTLAARDRESLRAALRVLRRLLNPRGWMELPARRIFKIGLLLGAEPLTRRSNPRSIPDSRKKGTAAADMRMEAEKIPFDLALSPRPFPRGALSAVRRLRSLGLMRRFGAVLDDKALGYRFSALVAWKARPARVESAGRILASFSAVSHCYERASRKNWPYRLYTVVHAAGRREGFRLIEEMASASGCRDYIVLETIRRLKRSSLRLPRGRSAGKIDNLNRTKKTLL